MRVRLITLTSPYIDAHNIMFNLQIAGALRGWGDQVNILIQEIKRNILYRRYKRCIGNVNALVDCLAHLMINVLKISMQI